MFYAMAVIGLLGQASADVYMHNPRGSNDRNCERNVNRNNGNRLFDSQNNNNGGYACPRGVGDERFQNEMGEHEFINVNDGSTFTQSKRMYYYSGSVLPIEWTNQHGCGYNAKVECEMVLQYACEDTLDPKVANFWPYVSGKGEAGTAFFDKQHFRSGDHIAAPRDGIPRDSNDAATDTIPDSLDAAIPDSREKRRFGMHESYDYYQLCQRTERNQGLYTADQNVRRTDRRGTRQNPNGNRNGLECPEERDYYPWWAPSPWIDIAILSDQAEEDEICNGDSDPTSCSTRCTYYMDNTMNFNAKGYCDVDHTNGVVQTKLSSSAWNGRRWYNNRDACEAAGFTWYEVSHASNINLKGEDFVCARTHYARSNQLGNAMGEVVSETDSSGVLSDHLVHGVNANRFIWQIPDIPTALEGNAYFTSNHAGSSGMQSAYKSCTLRMRYNISTGDFQQWPEDATVPGTAKMVDSRNNTNKFNDPDTPLEQDPYIYIGNHATRTPSERFVSLAVNTNQYGRTFQDRSYSFSIKGIPDSSMETDNYRDTFQYSRDLVDDNLKGGGKIYNVNVRGKRGNIVQVYPSVEYDFVPNALKLGQFDMIHFQWTGSDYNPRRGCNNGEGGPPDPNDYVSSANANLNSRADRSNVVFQDFMSMQTPKDYLGYDPLNNDLTLSQKIAAEKEALLANAPCYKSGDSVEIMDMCYELLVRLSYLNQQADIGALLLRQGRQCLTEEELENLNNNQIAENHPLNCAKMNAKPFTYFDGGLMMLRKMGFFPFFSSRNNNFSNRDQKGVICIGDCPTNQIGGVDLLQQPPSYNSGQERPKARSSKGSCEDTLNSGDGANANGATSCAVGEDSATGILQGESFTIQEGDNDNYGDGNSDGCTVLSDRFLTSADTIEEQVTLAIILFFVGLVFAWIAYYLFNRWKASHAEDGKFRGDTSWQGSTGIAGVFEMMNPFKKVPTEAVV